MQRYRWPGYDMQLLGELQKQQNNAQFCDVLLKTEGISVPTHSCILAALSPYLSQKLSASPPPPSGERRELRLHAVTARTLLKLVGLLYSGEVEVKGSAEQNDLLAAACRFGIAHLVEGRAGGRAGEGSRQNGRVRSRREEEEDEEEESGAPRAEGAAGRNAASPIEKRRRASAGRRSSSSRSARGEPPSSEPEAAVLGRGAAPRPQSAAADNRRFVSPPSSLVSDGELAFGGPTDPAATSSAFSFSLDDDDSGSARASAGEAARPTVRRTNGKPAVVREDEERPRGGGETRGRGRGRGRGGGGGKSAEMRHARPNVGIKSLAKLRRMQMEKQISIKVKLRRRTNEEVWEVVSMQNTDEALSLLTSLKRDGSGHQRLQTEPPPSCCVQPGPTRNPEPAPTLHPAAAAAAPPERQLDHGLDHGLDRGLESSSPPPPQPPGPADECDEQIEKLLEDIMMGLNILPNLDRDCKKPHYLQPSHGAAEAVCREPAAQNEQPRSRMHGGAGPAGCEYYPDFGTQIGHASTDPGIYCCFTAQNQPGCSSLPSAQPSAQPIHQRPCFPPRYHPADASAGPADGTSHRGAPLSKTRHYPYPETLAGQKPLPPALLELLPPADGSEARSFPPSACVVGDLRLPLSPLSPPRPSVSAADRRPPFHLPSSSTSTNRSGGVRPWLAVTSKPLQFPFSAITHGAGKSESPPPAPSRVPPGPTQLQKHLESNRQRTPTASLSVKEAEEGGATPAGRQNAAEPKDDVAEAAKKKKKKKVKRKEADAQGDRAVPKKRKRKRAACAREATPPSARQQRAKGQINLSVCLVSLSSNNVLAKEREMAAGSNKPDAVAGKASEPPAATGSPGGAPRDAGGVGGGESHRVRTRGFVKKTLATPSRPSVVESLPAKPEVRREPPAASKREAPKRRPGRPRKTRAEGIPPESLGVKTEAAADGGPAKEESGKTKEESGKTKGRKKRVRDRSRAEAVATATPSAEATLVVDDGGDAAAAAAASGGKAAASKRPRMVSLKEFEKLIKRQHSKTRKSKESRDEKTGEAAEVAGGEDGEAIEGESPRRRDAVAERHAGSDGHSGKRAKKSAGGSQRDERSGERRRPGAGSLPLASPPVVSPPVVSPPVVSPPVVSPPVVSLNVEDLVVEEAELPAETEEPRRNPDEAPTACEEGESDEPLQTEGSSLRDLPKEDHMVHNANPQSPERTAPPRSFRSSRCDQEEEVEVDVLLLSPDKDTLTTACENGLHDMETSPEEEEEEEDDVIDVTGD